MHLALIEMPWHRGWRTQKSSKNQLIEQYQEMDDLDNMTQKPTSEMPRRDERPCLSREL
jgi:hypothetical protein